MSIGMSVREKCLLKAKEIVCTDRNEQYGEPEDNFSVIAEFWSTYINNRYGIYIADLDSDDVANMMVLFKMGRITTAGDYKDDSYIDMAGYAACAAECASKKYDEAKLLASKLNRVKRHDADNDGGKKADTTVKDVEFSTDVE